MADKSCLHFNGEKEDGKHRKSEGGDGGEGIIDFSFIGHPFVFFFFLFFSLFQHCAAMYLILDPFFFQLIYAYHLSYVYSRASLRYIFALGIREFGVEVVYTVFLGRSEGRLPGSDRCFRSNSSPLSF